jgi:hypothetical protein
MIAMSAIPRSSAREEPQGVAPRKPLLQEDIQTDRNHGCELAHLSALGWNHAGGDARTSTHDPRLLAHSNLHVTNNKYLQATSKSKRLAPDKFGRRHFADGYFAKDKPNPMRAVGTVFGWDLLVRRLSFPNIP